MKSPPYTFWNLPWFEKARRSDAVRYSFSLLCTAGAMIAWVLMDAPLADATPYQVLLPFVALAAWFGGTGPGILTTVGCTLWAITHSDGDVASLHQQLELVLFFPIGAFIAGLCGSLGKAREVAQTTANQLAISQQRYQSIVETASEGIWMTDTDFKTIFVNARMASLLGTTPDDMLGRKVNDYLFPEDQDVPALNVAHNLGQGHYNTESRYRHSSGEPIWFLVNVSLQQNAAGQLTGYLALHTDITERRRQSQELKRSNDRFERATKAVAGYIYEQDLKTDTIFRSSGFMDVLGYDPTRIPNTQQWWREQLNPADLPHFEAMAQISHTQGEQFSLEYRARHADGSYRWLWDRGLVIRDEDGGIQCVVGSVSDISARRSMEMALRESEANFRQLADSMPQIVWSSNPRGVPDYFNRRWYEYSGQADGTVGSGSWEAFHHPEDAARVRSEWENAMASAVPFRAQIRLRDKHGGYRWFLCRANPVFDGTGEQIVRWFATATDIDEQKHAADSQTFLANVGVLLGGSLDPQITLEQVTRLAVPHLGDWCFVALKNSEGVPEMVAAAHRSTEKLAAFWKRHTKYGFVNSATQGFPWVIRTGQPEIVEQTNEQMWRETIPQEEYRQEIREASHRSTMIVPLEVRGQILGAIGFSYAETDRHFSESDLPLAQELARRAAIAIENARLYRQLQDADRRKDEFLAMLAHELRNPLAAISGARSLMDELLEGEAKIITGTPRAILERQISQLSRLVDDLLDVSRITRGKIELRRKHVDFCDIVRNALDGVRPLILSRRHNLQVELPQGPVPVDADPARLGQIVSNLVTNAAKYTDPSGQITVSLGVSGHEAILRVRDNGTGLSPEMLQSIWGLFVQSDRTLERSQGGLGIGLTLVKSLAEMHGGRVGASSEGLGQGSEFFVALPLLAPQPETEQQTLRQPVSNSIPETGALESEISVSKAKRESNVPSKTTSNSSTSNASISNASTSKAPKSRILVVDDNEDAAMMLCAYLESCGHDVQVAHDGAQGLILACGWQPDVALLDIGMPGMDGYEVARKLRTLPEGVGMRLIAVTGYGQPADRDLAIEAGFNFHLTKPVDIEELKRMIETGN
jgi:PAS domain S-box-containing protein